MPRMNFQDLYTQVESISNVTSQRTLIKHAIQMGLDRATASKDLSYLMIDSFITTIAPYETGTVSATNGSKTITGSGTTFTAAMVGRKIRIDSQNAYYRITAFVSTTEVTLEVSYQGTTVSGKTYSIYKDEYKMPADCNSYKILRQIENSISIIGIEASAFDMLEPTPKSKGSPNYEILAGSKLDTYSTGSVSGTVAASVITGSSTVWTGVEGLSKGSRITVGVYTYTVKSVDSDTQITIYEKIAVTFSASAYSISLDNLIIQLFEIPDAAENIYFRYQRLAFPLINDTDIPDLPEQWHWILVHAGLAWAWMTKDKEEAIRQEGIFRSAMYAMWEAISGISRHAKFPRTSQDDIAARGDIRGPRMPEGYSLPFSR